MAKLTTLEGDQDFYGTAYRSPRYVQQSFLGCPETMLGFSITKLAKGAVRVTKKATKAVVKAPAAALRIASKTPAATLRAIGAPKAVVKGANILTSPLRVVSRASNKATDAVVNTAFKVPEVVAPALAKGVGKAAEFAARHPYATAPLTAGLSITGAMTTKRGRQALAFKKPGYRTAPGLTGADKDEYLVLKNKGKRTADEEARLTELAAKGKAKVEADKAAKAAAQQAAQQAASQAAASSGASGGASSGGSGGYDTGAQQESGEPEKSGILGPALLAAGLGALMLL